MENIFAVLILISLILLIIGFFSPNTSLFWYKKEKTKKKSSIIYGITVVISFILFGISTPDTTSNSKSLNDGNDTITSIENSIEQNSNEEKGNPTEIEAKIGDEITIGNFIYRVNKMQYAKTISDEFTKETADGIYLIINLSLKNVGNEQITIDNSLFKLTDENGTQYQTSSNASLTIEMDGKKSLMMEECNPNIQKQGFLVFEVPKKDNYNLQLSDGFWSDETAIIKLSK